MRHRIVVRLVALGAFAAGCLLGPPLARAREFRTIGTLWIPEIEAVRGLPVVSFSELSDAGPRGGAWLQPIRVVKRLDAGSPLLLEALATGRRLQTVQLRMAATGAQPQVDWTLSDVVLVGHEVGPGKSDPTIYETVSMRPSKVRMDVTTATGTVGTCWDWAQRRPC